MCRLFLKSYKDRAWLFDTNANGDKQLRRYTATTSTLIYTGGIITQASYFLIGVVAMTQPTHTQHATAAQILTAIILISASTVGSLFAGMIYIRRNFVVKALINRREHG